MNLDADQWLNEFDKRIYLSTGSRLSPTYREYAIIWYNEEKSIEEALLLWCKFNTIG